jgi:trans-2,3-dihydro-3-hydroxyanthranilate isomerase
MPDSREFHFHTLDVFTDRVFGGNPLAVLTDARGLSDDEMMRITREFNLSETVFILPPDDPAHTVRARIFTPGSELPFAGHPTVGTAFLLVATGMVRPDGHETRVILEEGVGPVPVTVRVERGVPVSAELTAAQLPEVRRDAPDVPPVNEIAAVLGVGVDAIGAGALAPAAVSCGVPYLLVPVHDQATVSHARFDTAAWERFVAPHWAHAVYVFDGSAAERGQRIRARMFAPHLGIGEDPATGSAAATLSGYLAIATAEHGGTRDGTVAWRVDQGVEMGRPSLLELSADLQGGAVTAVRVGGSAVLVSEGTLRVPRETSALA